MTKKNLPEALDEVEEKKSISQNLVWKIKAITSAYSPTTK